jgi:hypothetical protein
VGLGRRLAREPLVHFALLGAALFAVDAWRGGRPGGRIVVTAGQVEHLSATFERAWQRPPDAAELDSLIEDQIRDEIASREAVALGLDQDDTVLRRRLRQKFEFLAEDAAVSEPPSDAELEAWRDAHAAAYRRDPRLSLRQVFLDPGRRGSFVEADAARLVAELTQAGPDAALDGRGERLLLPAELGLTEQRELASAFGPAFADAVAALEPGRWAGPVRSSFGLHVVLVRERVPGRVPATAEIRPALERDLLAARRSRALEELYGRLRGKYRVVVESAAPADAAPRVGDAARAPAASGS